MWPVELINYLRRNYEPPTDFSEVEQEAEYMREQLQKQAAGRIPLQMSQAEEAALREEYQGKRAQIDWDFERFFIGRR